MNVAAGVAAPSAPGMVGGGLTAAPSSGYATPFDATRTRCFMAVPKRRQSNQKTRSRRAHDFLTPRQLTFCSNCGKAVPTHRICGTCGHYMGRAVVKAED